MCGAARRQGGQDATRVCVCVCVRRRIVHWLRARARRPGRLDTHNNNRTRDGGQGPPRPRHILERKRKRKLSTAYLFTGAVYKSNVDILFLPQSWRKREKRMLCITGGETQQHEQQEQQQKRHATHHLNIIIVTYIGFHCLFSGRLLPAGSEGKHFRAICLSCVCVFPRRI